MISSLQLAALCGVSQGTVDRALHGRAGIAPATREKILAAAKRLGYAPNPAARELMTGRNLVCGAILPAGSGVFFMDLIEELRQALKRRGLTLLIAPASDAHETLEALGDFAARRVKGIALVPPSDDFEVPAGVARSTSVVSLASPCLGKKVRYIAPDEVQAGFDGTGFLWGLGHRRIGCLTYPRQARAITERRDGYARLMRSMGAEPQILIPESPADIFNFVRRSELTALFCHNDWLALNALRALEGYGVKVPDDISLMGVDDSPTFTGIFQEMSTLAYPYAAIAEAAAAVMAGERKTTVKMPRLEIRRRRTVRSLL